MSDFDSVSKLLAEKDAIILRLTENVERLEEECNLLAERNHNINQELEELKEFVGPDYQKRRQNQSISLLNELKPAKNTSDAFPHVIWKLSTPHGGTNVLCCRVLEFPDNLVISSGFDRRIAIFGVNDGHLIADCQLSAPCLCIEANRRDRLLACACLDGSVHIINYGIILAESNLSVHFLPQQSIVDHSKPVISVLWTSNQFLVTSSHDKSCKMYAQDLDGSFHSHQVFCFPTVIESMTIASLRRQPVDDDDDVESIWKQLDNKNNNNDMNEFLILSTRDSPYLTYIDVNDPAGRQLQVTVNSNNLDNHASFTVLHLAVNGRYLTLSTDSPSLSIIILETGTNHRLTIICPTSSSNGYGTPKAVWWPADGGWIILTNQSSGDVSEVVAYDVRTGIKLRCIKNHDGQVRDLSSSESCSFLVSCSYDKSLVLWGK